MKRIVHALFERFLLTGAALLALAALAGGAVSIPEIPGLMDVRLLSLFAVLTVAVELGRESRLFDTMVARTVRRARSARGLALTLVGLTGVLAMFLTNDVALFLVVPFTLLFRRVSGLDLAPIVVLEISSANLIGALTPIGNPQNLFLFSRGGFTAGSFVAAQAPLVLASALLLAAGVRFLVPARAFQGAAEGAVGAVGAVCAVPPEERSVDRTRAAAFAVLLAAQLASLFRLVPHGVPLALGIAGAALLGPRLLRTDFSLVLVFALLFIGVAGLERGSLYRAIDPERLFGSHARGLLLSSAALSQLVSNVPAALLLAPAAAGAAGFRGLLWGVTVGGCGTPIASIANLIGAQLYLRSGVGRRRFWRLFCSFSGVALVTLVLFALAAARLFPN